MAYKADCDDCGTRVPIPASDEEIREAQRGYRTISEEYRDLMLKSRFGADPEERARAEQAAEKRAKWDHYCGDCARDRGLVSGVASARAGQ